MEHFCPALLLAVLMAALRAQASPCLSAGADMSEISGDELPEVSGDAPSKWESLAGALVCDVVSLRDAQFAEAFPKEKMDFLKDHKVPVPYLVQEDGCFPMAFSKKMCLQQIAEGLHRYKVYLKFVEQEYPQQTQVRDIVTKTNSLIHIMKEKVKTVQLEEFNSDVKNHMLSQLPSNSRWNRNISVHVILRQLSTFVTDAYRAIRYINKRQRREWP